MNGSRCQQQILSVSAQNIEDKKIEQQRQQQRKIGYSICEAKEPCHRQAAIVLFVPLSATSLIVDASAESGSFDDYQASVMCIDRPGVANTDALPPGCSSIERMERHTHDVLAVLSHHGINKAYLLGMCIGHPYAVCVAKRLLKRRKENEEDDDSGTSIKLMGLTLLAPFVSPACPDAWRVARLGATVPSIVLRMATSTCVWIGSASIPVFLTPKKLKNLITEEEKREFGWSEGADNGDDFERAVKLALKMHESSSNKVQAIEARLGVDPSWQELCDEFGAELRQHGGRFSSVPIEIYASREDKVAPRSTGINNVDCSPLLWG